MTAIKVSIIIGLVALYAIWAYYTAGMAWLRHCREKHLKWFNNLHQMHDRGDIPGPDWKVTAMGFDADIQAKSPIYWFRHWRDIYPTPTLAYRKNTGLGGVWSHTDIAEEDKPWH